MAAKLYIYKIAKNFQAIPISKKEWEQCVVNLPHLRIIEIDLHKEIQTYSTLTKGWLPIFWISEDGTGYMKQASFFAHKDCFDKGIEIAALLNASIVIESGEIIYLQDFGLIYDDISPEVHLITKVDLMVHNIFEQMDFKKSVNELIKSKGIENKNNFISKKYTSQHSRLESSKKWWHFWK